MLGVVAIANKVSEKFFLTQRRGYPLLHRFFFSRLKRFLSLQYLKALTARVFTIANLLETGYSKWKLRMEVFSLSCGICTAVDVDI